MQLPNRENIQEVEIPFFDNYRSALLSGDANAASEGVEHALASGLSPSQIYTSILMPAQTEITKLLSDCKLGVCEEHRATEITLAEMARLRLLIKPLSHLGFKAVISAVEGDEHFLGARIVADLLLFDGWEVHFLGAKTPANDLVEFVGKNDFDLVGLAATDAGSIRALEKTSNALKNLENPPKIIVGGDAVYNNLDLVKSLDIDGIAFNAHEAVKMARLVCGISEQDTTLARYLKSLGERIIELRKAKKFSQSNTRFYPKPQKR